MSDHKFVTKKGKGAVCYRVPRKENGKTVYGKNYIRRLKRGGQQFYFNLGTEKRQAEQISNEIDDFLRDPRNSVEDAMRRFNPDSIWKNRNSLTIETIIRAHEKAEANLELGKKTAKNYRGRLLWIVRRVMCYRSKRKMESMKYEDAVEFAKDFSVNQLNQRFISDLKMSEMKDVPDSVMETNKAKRHLQSVIMDARAVFSGPALKEYELNGIKVPDISDFMKGSLFRRVTKKIYRLPDHEVIKTIFKDVNELREDLNAYRIYLLAIGAGLRREEIFQLQQEWIRGGDNPTVFLGVTDEWQQKGKGESQTEICKWAYKELCNVMEDGDRVLTGTITDADKAARRLANWLRGKGLDRKKPIHELRMLFGSWVANRRGIYAAQKILRHKTVNVTNEHYADLIVDDTILKLWEPAVKKTA